MKRLFFLFVCILAATISLEARKNTPLKVVSYNIRNGKANDGENAWAFRAPASPAMFRDIRPDICGIQEAYIFQVRYLEENLKNYRRIGVGRNDGKEGGEMMAIFYNKKTIKLLEWGTWWLSETPDTPSKGWDAAYPRTATWAIMKHKASGRKFLHINTHLDHKGVEAKEKGLAFILQKIKEYNLPVVLTGDFNMTADNPVMAEVQATLMNTRETAGRTDHEGTFHSWGRKSNIIDYIFYKGFTSCPEYRTFKQTYLNVPFLSDHYPIEAELVF